jgi:hypothetical protein
MRNTKNLKRKRRKNKRKLCEKIEVKQKLSEKKRKKRKKAKKVEKAKKAKNRLEFRFALFRFAPLPYVVGEHTVHGIYLHRQEYFTSTWHTSIGLIHGEKGRRRGGGEKHVDEPFSILRYY